MRVCLCVCGKQTNKACVPQARRFQRAMFQNMVGGGGVVSQFSQYHRNEIITVAQNDRQSVVLVGTDILVSSVSESCLDK